MNARIIVIKNCSDCPDSIQGFLTKHKVCSRMFYEERRCPDDGTPDWCPLRPLPEKREMNNAVTTTLDFWSEGWMAKGWNDCLDEITGEEEE